MPNRTEIEELKKANGIHPNAVVDLIDKWEKELNAKELMKSGAVHFILHARKGDAVKDVIGKLVAPDFALHKDVWGGKSWVLTHIPSEVSVLNGTKIKIAVAIKELLTKPWLETLNSAMKEHGIEALKHIPQETIDDYRAVYDLSR